MKYLIYILAAAALLLTSCEDDPVSTMMEEEVIVPPTPCELGRYITPAFTEISVTTKPFGMVSTGAGEVPLLMDIYTPDGDTLTDRPVVILAFGGAFVTGDRSQMEETATYFASRGYVAAAIDYRIYAGFGLPSGEEILDVAVKAMHDVKGAVRYLRNDAMTDNQYGIDPEQIIVGGISAGAIASLQAAFLDEGDLAESDDQMRSAIALNGGIEGTSNDIAVSSSVIGVLNYSGALYDLDFIDAGDPWVISTHGDADTVVPYLTGRVQVGFPIDFELNGSGVMHPRLEEAGITHYLETVAGGGHVDIYTDAAFAASRVAFAVTQSAFVSDRICE